MRQNLHSYCTAKQIYNTTSQNRHHKTLCTGLSLAAFDFQNVHRRSSLRIDIYKFHMDKDRRALIQKKIWKNHFELYFSTTLGWSSCVILEAGAGLRTYFSCHSTACHDNGWRCIPKNTFLRLYYAIQSERAGLSLHYFANNMPVC